MADFLIILSNSGGELARRTVRSDGRDDIPEARIAAELADLVLETGLMYGGDSIRIVEVE